MPTITRSLVKAAIGALSGGAVAAAVLLALPGTVTGPAASPSVTLTALDTTSAPDHACRPWLQDRADHAAAHGHPGRADVLDHRANRRADRYGCV